MAEYLKNCLGLGCGVLHWPPEAFWQSTPFDLQDAWQGFQYFHGLKTGNDLTGDDVRELRRILNEKTHVL